jgi:uncharacterized pyridoxal phosphate-containing UPF0001 family protein
VKLGNNEIDMGGLGFQEILANYQRVVARIEEAARSARRSLNDIKLVVLTKGQPVESIHAAIQAGWRSWAPVHAI